jgi:hypothetical protein
MPVFKEILHFKVGKVGIYDCLTSCQVKRMKSILKNSVNIDATCVLPPFRSPFTGHMTFSRAFCGVLRQLGKQT